MQGSSDVRQLYIETSEPRPFPLTIILLVEGPGNKARQTLAIDKQGNDKERAADPESRWFHLESLALADVHHPGEVEASQWSQRKVAARRCEAYSS